VNATLNYPKRYAPRALRSLKVMHPPHSPHWSANAQKADL
jgi:hypothetical protein